MRRELIQHVGSGAEYITCALPLYPACGKMQRPLERAPSHALNQRLLQRARFSASIEDALTIGGWFQPLNLLDRFPHIVTSGSCCFRTVDIGLTEGVVFNSRNNFSGQRVLTTWHGYDIEREGGQTASLLRQRGPHAMEN